MTQRNGPIVAASDLSMRSVHAVERGVELAREAGAPLRVVHVVDEDTPQRLREQARDWAATALREQVEARIDATGAGVAYEVDLLEGRAAPALLAHAAKLDARVIVTGTHRGFGDAGAMFPQATAGKLYARADRPVLVATFPPEEPYREVVVACDFSPFARAALREAIKAAPSACFHLVHAYHVPYKGFLGGQVDPKEFAYDNRHRFDVWLEEEMSRLSDAARAVGMAQGAFDKVLREGSPERVIRDECARLNAGLLVIGTHGRTGFARAFLGSVAADLLNNPPCDVMAVKPW